MHNFFITFLVLNQTFGLISFTVVVNFGAEYALKPSLGTVDTVGTCPPIYFQYLGI